MAFINATPHELNIFKSESKILTVPPCGVVIRVDETRSFVERVDGVMLTSVLYGDLIGIEDLPPVNYNDIVIVSAMALTAISLRDGRISTDGPTPGQFASPGEAVRDASGQIIGCKGLTVL